MNIMAELQGRKAYNIHLKGNAMLEKKLFKEAEAKHAEAIAAYRENLRLDPGDWYAHNNLGNVYRATQRRREALDAYRAAVRAQPDYIPAWHNLGVTFYDLKGPAGVAEALRRLHATDPGLAEAWRGLAIDYSLSRDPRVALAAIRILRRLSDAERERMFAILDRKSVV